MDLNEGLDALYLKIKRAGGYENRPTCMVAIGLRRIIPILKNKITRRRAADSTPSTEQNLLMF